jgi:hypothetical protein
MADRQPRYCQICKTYRVFEGDREVEPCACEECPGECIFLEAD